jgi:hypothetical protein
MDDTSLARRSFLGSVGAAGFLAISGRYASGDRPLATLDVDIRPDDGVDLPVARAGLEPRSKRFVAAHAATAGDRRRGQDPAIRRTLRRRPARRPADRPDPGPALVIVADRAS